MTTRSYSIHVGQYPSGGYFMSVLEQHNDRAGKVRHEVYATFHPTRESLRSQLDRLASDLLADQDHYGDQPLPGV